MSIRGTAFMLTVWKVNSKDEPIDYDALNNWYEDLRIRNEFGFVSGQMEEGEEHHAHLQLYCETKLVGKEFQKLGIKAVRSLLHFGDEEIDGHIEVCKSPEDAKKYVHKEEGRLQALSSIGEMRVGRYDKLYLRMIGTYVPGTITTHSFI